jgi:hypothetical protein
MSILTKPHFRPLALLTFLALFFWSRVLFTGDVLLPGEMLRGFYPFGGDLQKPWTILQWDSLAQYFPWRHFAAESLRNGQIPLWNPYQFTGTPMMANAQSAIFYPLNFPFLIMDTAYAFGVCAFLHTLLAAFSTYFLCQRWGLSRTAAVVSATAFAFCGYLASWALLPTLFATASWLPLCVFLYEKASDDEFRGRSAVWLGAALCMALLAGHAQIFFYVLLAVALRQPFLKRKWRGMAILGGAFSLCVGLGAGQLLPTLELSNLSHRSRALAGPPTLDSWNFVKERALTVSDFGSLILPAQPSTWGTLNENFGYLGFGVLILAVCGLFFKSKAQLSFGSNPKFFALTLLVFGLLYALGTPVAQLFYFGVPGISQMGGTGRVLLLWSFGGALLAGFGLDFLLSKLRSLSLPSIAYVLCPAIALFIIGAELFFNAFAVQPTAPREQIYPQTALTKWLQEKSSPQSRVLFYTPKRDWLPTELFREGQTHPLGVLPPNGATVYGIHDVNGYDSLAINQYRGWVASEEAGGVSPALNGNIVLLNNLVSPVLNSLAVRYVVVPQVATIPDGIGKVVFSADGCDVYERVLNDNLRVNGAAFYPGWKEGKYKPETLRFGLFVSLCTLTFLSASLVLQKRQRV